MARHRARVDHDVALARAADRRACRCRAAARPGARRRRSRAARDHRTEPGDRSARSSAPVSSSITRVAYAERPADGNERMRRTRVRDRPRRSAAPAPGSGSLRLGAVRPLLRLEHDVRRSCSRSPRRSPRSASPRTACDRPSRIGPTADAPPITFSDLVGGVARGERREHERVRRARQPREPVVLLRGARDRARSRAASRRRSRGRAGARARCSIVRWIRVTSGCRTEPKFEYEIIATRGVTPKPCTASAICTVMSASVSASGKMLNTVSPKNFTEFCSTIMYMPTATFTPGCEAEDLEQRPHGLGIVEPQAGDHAVGVAALDHERRVVVALRDQRLRGVRA